MSVITTTMSERKCALLLVSLCKRDRRYLLSRLPTASSRAIRGLVAELESLPFPVQSLADELIGDEMLGLTMRTSLELDQLIKLSRQVSPAWFARVLSVWTGVDRNFCLSMLEAPIGAAVKRELDLMPRLPPKLIEAIKSEAIVMAGTTDPVSIQRRAA